MYDILIRNALVVDGSGAPGYVGDVAVKSGKLVTNPTSGEAKQVIDATGLVLSPGFIDAHCISPKQDLSGHHDSQRRTMW